MVYYTFAQELAAKASETPLREAYLRNCISRSYYNAFCLARLQLKKEGITFVPGGSVDSKVRLVYSASTNRLRSNIALQLYNLVKLRNAADYEQRVSKLSKKAKLALEYANSIITDLKNYNNEQQSNFFPPTW